MPKRRKIGKRKCRPFSEARAFVHTLNLKNRQEWHEYCRSGNKPADIPSRPKKAYRGEFVSIGDWLGTGTIAISKRVYRDYSQARAFVHTLGLKSRQKWIEYCRSSNKPADILTCPDKVYRGEFVRMGDWLGK